MEVEQAYLSSPSPDTKLGRTVETSGTHDNDIYVTPATHTIFQTLWGLSLAAFLGQFCLRSSNNTSAEPVPQQENGLSIEYFSEDPQYSFRGATGQKQRREEIFGRSRFRRNR